MNNGFAFAGMATVSAMAFAPFYFQTSFQEVSSARSASQSRVSRVIPRQNTTYGEVSWAGQLTASNLSAPPLNTYMRALTVAEDRVFHLASLRSVNVISKGRFIAK